MGNAISGDLSKNHDNLLEKLDTIAANLIIKEDFNEMKKLFDKEYCERLQVLTSQLLHENFSDIELHKIIKRIKMNN